MRPRRHPRRAVTLIEAVLFIAIALGLIVGGLVFFQQAQTASRTMATVRLLSALLVEARTLPPQPLAQVDRVLIARGAVPSNAVDGDAIVMPWGGVVTVFAGVADIDGAHSTWVQLNLDSIPVEICARITPFDPDGTSRLGDGLAILVFWDVFWDTGEFRVSAPYDALVPADLSAIVGADPALTGDRCRRNIYSDGAIGLTEIVFFFRT
jgi:drug/metabolite transporter superfamily protein YnfA